MVASQEPVALVALADALSAGQGGIIPRREDDALRRRQAPRVRRYGVGVSRRKVQVHAPAALPQIAE